MTKNGRRWCMVVLVLLWLVLGVASVHARSVTVESLQVEAEILPNGSMEVEETYEVDFYGQWNGMFRYVYLKHGMTMENLQVWENDQPFTFQPGDSYGPPGTFIVKEEEGKTYVDWSIDANNVRRTYTFRYRVNDAVLVHNDVAELYYQFVGSEWEVPFQRVDVNLTLPAGASVEDLRVWGHGPLHGSVDRLSGRQVRWQVTPLPSETMVEGRVVFPLELVPQGTNRTGETALDRILKEEGQWARQANAQRWLLQNETLLAPVLVLLAAIGFFLRRLKFKRKYTLEFQGDYYRELPAAYSPAVLSYLWNKKKSKPEVVMATIMDLARRGYLKIEEFEPEQKGFTLFRKKRDQDYYLISQGENMKELTGSERKLMELLFQDVAGTRETEPGARVSLGQIEEYTKKTKTGRVFHQGYTEYSALVNKEAEAETFFEWVSVKSALLQVLLSVLLGFGGIITILVLNTIFLGIALIVAGVIGLVFLSGMSRYTKKGLEQYNQWKAFRKFLTDFSLMDQREIPALVVWEHYLVYAIPLGVAKEVIKQLQLVFPSMEQNGYRFGAHWYVGSQMMNYQHMDRFVSTAERSFDNAVKASVKASPSSSGSGGGGGFSGGGGGGSGGGGGGFR